MTAREIIDAYALRWTIEPMFCSLKHGSGVQETWQRRRQTLHRWLQPQHGLRPYPNDGGL